MTNEVGIIGLGKIGLGITKRLAPYFKVSVFDIDENSRKRTQFLGVNILESAQDVAKSFNTRKKIILSLPAGKTIDNVIEELIPNLSRDDIVADFGNSNFGDSIRRSEYLEKKDIFYLDVGTSGGLEGSRIGYSLMMGGELPAYRAMVPIFERIAMKNGFNYVGESGSGHYVKMVHNAIEYGLLQAIAEGVELLKESDYKFDLERITGIWRNGSIIRSYLIELLNEALKLDPNLKEISGVIGGGETGKWALDEADRLNIKMTAIKSAYEARVASRNKRTFATKVVATLRKKFGGHIPP